MIFPNFSQPNQHQPTPHDANRDSTKFTNPGQLFGQINGIQINFEDILLFPNNHNFEQLTEML